MKNLLILTNMYVTKYTHAYNKDLPR